MQPDERQDTAPAGPGPDSRPPTPRVRPRAAVVATVRRLPGGERLVARLHETLPWRPGVRDIPVDRLLLGLQNRVRADEFAAVLDNPLWPSTRVGDGPHAELIRMASTDGELTDEQILTSSYADLARACISLRGFFFTATDDEGIVAVARNYLARHRGEAVRPLGEHQSAADSPIRVAPVRWSDCFQMLDGHHRVASAAVAGKGVLPARVKWTPVTTPLQRLLLQSNGTGARLLRQPLDAPEVASWPVEGTGAALPSRTEGLVALLGAHGLATPSTTHLDLASGYGWGVARMADAGLRSEGLEPDPVTRLVGVWALGLSPERMHVGDPVGFLASSNRTWDVVTLLQPERIAAETTARLATEIVARATGAVVLGGADLAVDGVASSLARALSASGRFSDPVAAGSRHPSTPLGAPGGRSLVLLRSDRG